MALVRPGTINDIVDVYRLMRMSHREGRYTVFPIDEDKTAEFVQRVLASDDYCFFVAEDNSGVFGCFVGYIYEPFFSRARFSCDQFVYVTPEKRKGSLAFLRLIRMYELWAQDKRADEIQLGASTGINDKKYVEVLERIGYRQSVVIVSKENADGR